MGIFAPPVKKVLAAAALSVTALTAVPAATVPAAATVVEVHGGTWDYGSSIWGVWSRYYHKEVRHSATVWGSNWVYSGCKKPFTTARASSGHSWDHTNEAYYNNHC